MNRDYKLLQQNQQISIARAKEDTRDAKNKEIAALKHKMEQVIRDLCVNITQTINKEWL